MRLYLIRHAHPDYPGGKKMCLGQKTDLPLSSRGFEQAKALGHLFSPLEIGAVFTSPMLRARQTACALAASRQKPILLDDLIELDGGEWDGLTFDEIHERYPQHFQHVRPSCPPGGETDEQGVIRAHAALDQIRAYNVPCAAAIAHGAIIRALLCDLLSKPMSEKKHIAQDYAAINILDYDGQKWRVEAMNLTAEAFSERFSL